MSVLGLWQVTGEQGWNWQRVTLLTRHCTWHSDSLTVSGSRFAFCSPEGFYSTTHLSVCLVIIIISLSRLRLSRSLCPFVFFGAFARCGLTFPSLSSRSSSCAQAVVSFCLAGLWVPCWTEQKQSPPISAPLVFLFFPPQLFKRLGKALLNLSTHFSSSHPFRCSFLTTSATALCVFLSGSY